MSRLKKEILSKLKEYAGKMGKDHLGGDDSPSPKRGGLRDFDGYDNVDYNKDMPMDEDSPESAHPQGSKKLSGRTTVMDMLDVISHKEFGPDYHKLSTKQKKEVHKLAIKGKLIKQSPFKESVNEGKVDRVVGHTRYKYVGDGRKGKAIVSGPMKDREKEAIIKRAKKAGYVAKPNMGGGVTIHVESVNEAKVNYNFSEDELKRVLKLLGRNASTEVKMIKAFEKAFGRKLTRDELFESVVQEAKVETERYVGKKGIIIMIRDGNKMISAIFKDKKNADKFNRNNPADVKKLVQLAKKTKYPKAIDESISEGMFSAIDQIRQDSKDVRDFVKNVFKDREFKKMSNDKDFIKYLKSIYEGVNEDGHPQNWMSGRTSDYHTALRGKNRDYSGGTNFKKKKPRST